MSAKGKNKEGNQARQGTKWTKVHFSLGNQRRLLALLYLYTALFLFLISLILLFQALHSSLNPILLHTEPESPLVRAAFQVHLENSFNTLFSGLTLSGLTCFE